MRRGGRNRGPCRARSAEADDSGDVLLLGAVRGGEGGAGDAVGPAAGPAVRPRIHVQRERCAHAGDARGRELDGELRRGVSGGSADVSEREAERVGAGRGHGGSLRDSGSSARGRHCAAGQSDFLSEGRRSPHPQHGRHADQRPADPLPVGPGGRGALPDASLQVPLRPCAGQDLRGPAADSAHHGQGVRRSTRRRGGSGRHRQGNGQQGAARLRYHWIHRDGREELVDDRARRRDAGSGLALRRADLHVRAVRREVPPHPPRKLLFARRSRAASLRGGESLRHAELVAARREAGDAQGAGRHGRHALANEAGVHPHAGRDGVLLSAEFVVVSASHRAAADRVVQRRAHRDPRRPR